MPSAEERASHFFEDMIAICNKDVDGIAVGILTESDQDDCDVSIALQNVSPLDIQRFIVTANTAGMLLLAQERIATQGLDSNQAKAEAIKLAHIAWVTSVNMFVDDKTKIHDVEFGDNSTAWAG